MAAGRSRGGTDRVLSKLKVKLAMRICRGIKIDIKTLLCSQICWAI